MQGRAALISPVPPPASTCSRPSPGTFHFIALRDKWGESLRPVPGEGQRWALSRQAPCLHAGRIIITAFKGSPEERWVQVQINFRLSQQRQPYLNKLASKTLRKGPQVPARPAQNKGLSARITLMVSNSPPACLFWF